ncbi:MAG: ketoacyl-ACP synthase III [Clostridiales bacterium]|jgi:3-oxoacyl-[acyl-carrier-protein] synthase-3|nr:ketoacyl-ACP synthase III [Clostridiales bacterium]
MKKYVGIIGMGTYVPEKVMTNEMLEGMVETNDEWITQRTGIKERHIIDDDMPIYEMGVKAAGKALKQATCAPEEIDLIIAATSTPDAIVPNVSCGVQNGIGAVNAAAFDISAACTGFIYALSIARQFIECGTYKKILVVSCEALSRYVDWTDRRTCILFGDGAGAAVVSEVENEYGIITDDLGADGTQGNLITMPLSFFTQKDIEERNGETKHTLWMEGGSVLKFAVRIMEQSTNKVLQKAGINVNDVKYVIPHQANIRIIDGAAKRLKLKDDQMIANIDKYGNTSSASIMIALDEALKAGKISKGDWIVLVGFGGGLTWGGILMKWAI